MFGEVIESYYNELMSTIKLDREINNWNVKLKLILWIFASIQRTPQRRHLIRRFLDLQVRMKKEYPDFDYSKDEDCKLNQIAKEIHLQHFANEEILDSNLEDFVYFVINRRWEVMKNPSNCYWITKDNPGFLYTYKGKSIIANASWNYSSSDCLFFPLSKDYGIHIFPYSSDDNPEMNFTNTPILRKNIPETLNRLFNRFSFVTVHRLIIAPNKETFVDLASEINQICT